MKKSILSIPFISTLVFSSALIADDFEPGWRLGAGYSGNQATSGNISTDSDNESYDSDSLNSVVIEGGYEFNKIVGLKLSYTQGNVDTSSKVIDSDGSYLEKGANHDIKTLTFSTDVGYTFQIAKFDIKPYAELGAFASNVDSYKTTQHYNSEGTAIGEMHSSDDFDLHHGVFGGLGVRTTWRNGIYLDLNAITYGTAYTRSSESDYVDEFYDDKITYRATVGWKF